MDDQLNHKNPETGLVIRQIEKKKYVLTLLHIQEDALQIDNQNFFAILNSRTEKH